MLHYQDSKAKFESLECRTYSTVFPFYINESYKDEKTNGILCFSVNVNQLRHTISNLTWRSHCLILQYIYKTAYSKKTLKTNLCVG